MKTVAKPAPERPFRPPDPNGRVPTVHLDWDEFYKVFCQAHGNWPVQVGGQMLFADGWSCNALSTAGPYNEPPSDLDHLVSLQVRYWRRRRDIVTGLRDRCENLLRSLNDLQKQHRLPLMQAQVRWDDEVGRFAKTNGEVDWEAIGLRLLWLAEDVVRCNRELAELGERT